jgi:hypothetical protein
LGDVTVRSLAVAGAAEEASYGYAPYLGTLKPAARLAYDGPMGPDVPFGWSLLRPGTAVARLEPDAVVLAREGRPDTRVRLDWSEASKSE